MAQTPHDRGNEAPGPPAGGARRFDRRTLIRRSLLAGGAFAAGAAGFDAVASRGAPALDRPARSAPEATRVASSSAAERPNILVILVDQLREPRWYGSSSRVSGWLPNLARLRRAGVSFARHFTAANDCTPSRAALLTGLYTHQTGCLITGGSTLDPGFPTWGSMLREHGYRTYWYGKWHLTHDDNLWFGAADRLEPYGFAGGTYPSPDGGPGQGWRVDPYIAAQFDAWYATQGGDQPWCTTVSFVNPHDIAWWYEWSDRVPAESSAPAAFSSLPPNFETPEAMIERGKPLLQRSLQDTAASSFGAVPFTGPDATRAWLPFLDLYLALQRSADFHIGRVLDTLASRPEIAARTVVVFSSDHGEYGASHGLRGKGAGAYDEAIGVPLVVADPRGLLTRARGTVRDQLSSSVDVAPLLLTIATGSDTWRGDSSYSHLAQRLDLAAILADPAAPGRPYVLHATDETVTEFATEPYAADAPLHVTAVRTDGGKYATYSNWMPGGMAIDSAGQQQELYDYTTPSGRLELHNAVDEEELLAPMSALLSDAITEELREPLPASLLAAQARGLDDYAAVLARVTAHAALARERHDEAPAAAAAAPRGPAARGLRSLPARRP